MAKKSNEKWIFLLIGAAGVYFLHPQIVGLVDKLKGGLSASRARSYYAYGGARAYHATPRAGHLRGWQKPGFPGQGHAYGRLPL